MKDYKVKSVHEKWDLSEDRMLNVAGEVCSVKRLMMRGGGLI